MSSWPSHMPSVSVTLPETWKCWFTTPGLDVRGLRLAAISALLRIAAYLTPQPRAGHSKAAAGSIPCSYHLTSQVRQLAGDRAGARCLMRGPLVDSRWQGTLAADLEYWVALIPGLRSGNGGAFGRAEGGWQRAGRVARGRGRRDRPQGGGAGGSGRLGPLDRAGSGGRGVVAGR